jgi:hypothetical protein
MREVLMTNSTIRTVTLATIALIAAFSFASALAAAGGGKQISKAPGLQHHVSKKHHRGVTGYAPLREVQAKGSKKGPYAPGETLDRETEITRKAGGGGGGGSGM